MALYEESAVSMVAALQSRAVSSEELVRALHARADAVEGAVRGFTEQYRDASLAAARQVDAARARGDALGPLAGLPISVKENFGLVGTPATVGVRARLARKATANSALVATALDAGCVILGKSNVPQLLLAIESHNDIWGTTYNPWNTGRVPGGSSGGEAALIASGSSPAGLGTDIGGSIRNPAAWCGICGLKPTAGRWSMVGVAGGQPGQEAIRGQAGPMARTVADVVMLMKALSPERQHALDSLVPPIPFVDPTTVDLSKITVGYYEDDGIFTPAASVRRAVREAVEALRAAGVKVVPYTPPRSWDMFEDYFGLLSADGFKTGLAVIEGEAITPQLKSVARLGRLPSVVRKGLAQALGAAGESRVSRMLGALGEKSVTRHWALVVLRNELKQAEMAAWREAGIDALVGPPTVTPAAIPGETHDWSAGAWHTMRYNLLDLPAGVVPVSTVRDDEQVRGDLVDRLDKKAARFEAGSAGLPVAAQIIARPWEEHIALAVMGAIEAGVSKAPGFPRTPVDPRGPR